MEREEKLTQIDQLQTRLDKVLSAQGQSLPAFQTAKASPGNTMVDLLESARSRTAELLGGNAEADFSSLRSQFADLIERIKASRFVDAPSMINDGSCISALDSTYSQLQSRGQSLEEARQEMSQLQGDLAALRDEQTQQKEEFAQQADKLKEQLASIESDRSTYRKDRDEEIDSFQQQIEDIKQQVLRGYPGAAHGKHQPAG